MSRFRLTRRPVGSFDLQFNDFVILAHIIIFQYIIYVARSFFVIIFISIKKISKSFNEQAQCVCVDLAESQNTFDCLQFRVIGNVFF